MDLARKLCFSVLVISRNIHRQQDRKEKKRKKNSGWYDIIMRLFLILLDGGRSVGDNLALFRVGDSVLVGFQLDFLFGRTGLECLLVGECCHYATDDRSRPVDLSRKKELNDKTSYTTIIRINIDTDKGLIESWQPAAIELGFAVYTSLPYIPYNE